MLGLKSSSSNLDSPSASSPANRITTKTQRSTADYSLSCAECRRLKLRCSRQQWPCETCVKRGIPHLCPDGIQTKETKSQQGGSTTAKSSKISSRASLKGSPNVTFGNDSIDSSVASRLAELERKIDLLIEVSGRGAQGSLNLPHNGSLHDLASIATNHYALEGSEGQNGTRDASASRDSEEAVREQQGTMAMHADGRAHYIGSNAHSMYLTREATEVNEGGSSDNRRVLFMDNLPSRPGSPTPIDLEAVNASHNISNKAETTAQGVSPQGTTPSTTESQPAHLIWATPGFRSPYSSTAIWNLLKPTIPDVTSAKRMIDVYYASVIFMFHPITREDFDRTIWTVFFGVSSSSLQDSTPPPGFHPHKIALLYSMLSLGVLLDVKRPQRDPVGKALYSCAWSALALSNFTEATSLEAILSLMHINMYLTWRRGGKYAESAYPLLGTMMRLAISTGLHRDPMLFSINEVDRERRRRVFWDIQCCEVFRAFAYCRPPALCDRHIDTRFPNAWKEIQGESGEMMPSSSIECQGIFHAWKCRQTQIMNQMLDECLCSKSSYRTTMRFDQELRQMLAGMPFWMQPQIIDFDRQAKDPKENLEETYNNIKLKEDMIFEMQRHTTLINQYQALLLLHRGWFSQAIQLQDSTREDKVNTKGSRLSPSIAAVNESASKIINLTISIWCQYSSLVIRWAFFWNALFSAAVCRGLYVVKCNSIDTEAVVAWNDLSRSILLLRKAVIGWAPLESPLGILERLNKRADSVMNEDTERDVTKEDKGNLEGEDLELIGDERKKRASENITEESITSNKRSRRSKGHSAIDSTKTDPMNHQDNLFNLTSSLEGTTQWLDDSNLGLPSLLSSTISPMSISLNQSLNNPSSEDALLYANSTSSSATATQLIQMLNSSFGWDDISSWNDLIVDL